MSMPAYSEASLASQAAFRPVMEAFARPGTVRVLRPAAAPAALSPAAAVLVQTLADYETPICLDPILAADNAVRDWIRFETGAPVVADPAQAAFALIADAWGIPDFAAFAQGTPDYPDRSTTLIVQVESFSGVPMTATGPGIETSAMIAAQPLPDDFLERWAGNRELFPRGIDLVLTAGDKVVALPRTVQLSKGDA